LWEEDGTKETFHMARNNGTSTVEQPTKGGNTTQKVPRDVYKEIGSERIEEVTMAQDFSMTEILQSLTKKP
jgi:hypothetical protein